jgi:uncharacterized membrane protein
MIMTSWDLINDPINVHGGHWVWVENGAYFGIPLSNYAGWLLTTLVVYFLYRWYEASAPPHLPVLEHATVSAAFWWLPVVGFAITLTANAATLVIADLSAQAMVGLFSMGAFLMAALARRL